MTTSIKLFAGELKLSYRYGQPYCRRAKLTNSKEAYKCLRQLYSDDIIEMREQLIVLYLDFAASLMGYQVLGIGGSRSCESDKKLLFQGALLSNASAIILCHNHPSGNIKPSPKDNELTDTLAKACDIMGIGFVDHIILTSDAYFSYADNGMLKR